MRHPAAISRRGLLHVAGAFGLGALVRAEVRPTTTRTAGVRAYHLSVSPDALDADPELIAIARDAGVGKVWLTGFLYGHWHYPVERLVRLRARIEAAGLAVGICNVPLGHPGDSLGAMAGDVPLTPPRHWGVGVRADGSRFAGTSLHPPATEENVAAVRQLGAVGARDVFLDDDFRLATGPGQIGGCFCREHRRQFLERHGFGEADWQGLLESVRTRSLTPVMRQWVEFTCDELTASFRAQQAAAPGMRLGIMVMYLGAEKAGIRLGDYRDVPFRVGELMFNDGSFAGVKAKTDELFSALFHRRFCRPGLAFSETTAFPANQLSARNMAAKLAVSTIADVRNTMYMSGLTAFPQAHWQTLGPAMRKQRTIHERLAGHVPRGPFKHSWGNAARSVGDDNPNSLFLASGVPFEVIEGSPAAGWTFLCDADARATAGSVSTAPAPRASSSGGLPPVDVVRPAAGGRPNRRAVAETLPALFALKRELSGLFGGVPLVLEEKPVVCAWYPTARAVLLWNLSERREEFTVRLGEQHRAVTVEALDVALLEEVR